MIVQVTTPGMIRGGGVMAAMLIPGHGRFSRLLRTTVVGASYVGSFAVDPKDQPAHYALVKFDENDDVPDAVRQYAPMAIGTANWIGIQTVLGHLAALLPLPRTLKAVLLGGAVAVADSWVGERTSSRRNGVRDLAAESPEPRAS